MLTDPIADMLIRIKNASMVDKPEVIVPYSKLKMSIAKILLKNNYLLGINRKGKKTTKQMVLLLNPANKVEGVKRISKPSKRVYGRINDIKKLQRKNSNLKILSTPKGLLTATEALIKQAGGEILFELW